MKIRFFKKCSKYDLVSEKNTFFSFTSRGGGNFNFFEHFHKAARNISKGEDITHSYVEVQEPLLTRLELLNVGKFFHCACPRCSDPTGIDTYSGSF